MAQMIQYPSAYLEILFLAKKQFNAKLGDERELLLNSLEEPTGKIPVEKLIHRPTTKKEGVTK